MDGARLTGGDATEEGSSVSGHGGADDGSGAAAGEPPEARSPYYPDRLLPIAGEHHHLAPATPERPDLAERYEAFSAQRENILLDYGYNTARAYWGDLDDIFWWCERRGFDIETLTESQFRQYLGLLRRRRYSESTVRRRRTAFRKWLAQVVNHNSFNFYCAYATILMNARITTTPNLSIENDHRRDGLLHYRRGAAGAVTVRKSIAR